MRNLVFLGVALAIAACNTPGESSPIDVAQPTVAVSRTMVASATLTSTPTPGAPPSRPAELEQPDGGPDDLPTGFTEEGSPYRGNPDAPVTLTEYSEFQ